MLGIEIPDKGFLELGTTAFNFTLMNPIFTASGMKKAFSFSVSVDATPINNKYLKYANRLDTSNDVKLDCIIHLANAPFLYGYLKIDSSANESYELTFVDYTTEFINESEIKGIKEVMNETITVVSTPVYFELLLINAPNPIPVNKTVGVKINEKIYSHTVTNPNGESYESAVQNLAYLINADFPNAADGDIIDDSITLSQPIDEDLFVVTIENQTGWNSYAWSLEVANYQHENHLQDWATYLQNIKNDTLGNLKVAFPILRNDKFYESNNDYSGVINDYDNVTGYKLNDTAHQEGLWENVIIPYVSLRYIIEKATEYLGYTIDSDFLETFFLCHSKSIDFEIIGQLNGNFYNVFKKEFNLKNFIPDLSIYDLLKEISTTLFVAFFEKNGNFSPKSINEILIQPSENWTSKATEIYKSKIKKSGITIEMQEDSKDEANQYSNYVIDDGKIPIELIATIYGNGYFEVPKDADFDLKILKYSHGNSPTCENYTTPTLTAQAQAQWLKILSEGKTITKILRLNTSDLRKIATFENPVKEIQHRNGFVKGIVKSVSFKASKNGISESTVEMLCF